MTQTRAYVQSKSDGRWRSDYFAVERNGIPLAIVVVISVKVAGIPIVNRVNRGPLFLSASSPIEDTLDVFRAIRRR